MSTDSTEEAEIPHFAYLALIVIPPFPREIAILCHHAETNDIFLLGGRVGPSPFTKVNKVEIFLAETLVLKIGFRLPSDIRSTMYLYWEQTVTKITMKLNILSMLRMCNSDILSTTLEILGVLKHLCLILNSKKNYSN